MNSRSASGRDAAITCSRIASSNTPTPLALTTTRARDAFSATVRNPASVAGQTSTVAQSGGSMSRCDCRSKASGS